MRTTVDIEAPLLKELKAIQKREGMTLGALVSRLLTDALSRRGRHAAEPDFEWTSRPMQPRVDLADKEAVHAILDRPSSKP